MYSVAHTGRIAGHGGTTVVFIGGGDGVGGRDACDATPRGRLLLILQDLFQLLLHLGLVENTIPSTSPSSTSGWA